MNKWIPARVLRAGRAPGTFDLDCKEAVDRSRVRLPEGFAAPAPGTAAALAVPRTDPSGGKGPLGLSPGQICFYKSSTHGWLPAQVVRWRPEDQSYDLDVKQQASPSSIRALNAGDVVEYHSTSADTWIMARVLRQCAEPNTFDLDCKEMVHVSRIRPGPDPPAGVLSQAPGSFAAVGAPQFPAAPYPKKAASTSPMAPLPESGAYQASEAAEAEELKQRKLEQLRMAMQSQDPAALQQRLNSQSVLSLQGEELDQAAHMAWKLEARPAAAEELRCAVGRKDGHAIEAALEAAVVVGVNDDEIRRAQNALLLLRSPVWQYNSGDGHHIDVRTEPKIDGHRGSHKLRSGDVFCVFEERKENGITYLQLSDGRGWVFDKKPGVGTMCRRYPIEEKDAPGPYIIIHHRAAVTPTLLMGANDEVIGKLSAGTIVNVVDVVENAQEKRIRGKLENPEGWISLMDTESGRRWAIRHGAQNGEPRALAGQCGG